MPAPLEVRRSQGVLQASAVRICLFVGVALYAWALTKGAMTLIESFVAPTLLH